MPRTSKHKSHKQSKHTPKESNDYSSDSEADVKMMESRSARITKESSHSASGEKRKLSASSHLKDGKDGKNLSESRGGDDREEYVPSKRRKDVLEGGNGDADRSIAHVKEKKKEEGLPVDSEKASRLRESKSSGDSKSRSSKRHESGVGKEDMNLGEKEKDKDKEREKGKEGHGSGYTNGDLKRESEKESGRKEAKGSKDTKEKEQGFYRDKKKNKERKRESEFQVANGDVTKKHVSHINGADEETPLKRGKEDAELMVQDEFPNPEVKDLEKKIHQSEGSIDGDRCQDARESDKRIVSSRGNRAIDVKYKDERYKNGSYKDEYEDDISKVDRRKDEKHLEDAEKDIKQRDIKHRENGDRAPERRNEKYCDDGERERRREHRHQEDCDKDERNMDGKYWEDRERDGRRKDDKYREDSERAKGSRGKYHEDGRKVGGRDVRYFEDGDKSGRVKDEKYREESDRHKEERHWKDYERDGGRRNGIQGDFHGDVRIRETKYRDERSTRSRFGDKPDAKNVREESKSSAVYYRKSNNEDNRSNYDDQGRPKDGRVRKRTPGKEDHSDFRLRPIEEQQHDREKKPTSNITVELVTDTGRSDSRNADFGQTSNRSRHQDSYISSSYTTRDQNRLLKQDEADYGEYINGGRVRHSVTSTREYVSSQLNENASQKDELHTGDLANERRLKTDIQNSPGLPIDKSPSSTVDRKWNRDGEETGQRGGGLKEAKAYSEKEERGSRELAAETHSTDESYRGCGDTGSMLSPFARNTHLYTSSWSLVPSPPDRGGIDNPLAFGSAGEDSRSNSNNRHRRMDNTSMSRGAGGPWNSLPNWTPPVTNGFMPFQPCAPPFGFHPMLPQFPGPPIYGLRPMDFNHPGIPFPIPDADRYTNGHGRTMGWRNALDDVCPPQLHGWETNNASISKNSHIFGSPDWNHGTLLGDRLSEAGGDEWTSSKSDTNLGLPSKSEKGNSQYSNCAEDLPLASKSGEQVNNEQIPSVDASQSTDVLDEKLPVAFQDTSEEILYAPKMSHKNKLQLCQVYLSVLDISADLTDPETFRKCTNLQNVDEKVISDAKDGNIFYAGEVAEDKEKSPSKYLDGSLFSTISDSLFQKALSLYLKQKDKLDTSRAKHLPSGAVHFVDDLKSDSDIPSFESFETEEVGPAIDEILLENMSTNCSRNVEQPNNLPKLEDLSNNSNQKCDESVAAVVDHRSEDTTNNINMKEENVCALEVQECAFESYPPVKTEDLSDGYSPGRNDGVVLPADQNHCQVFPVTTKHDPVLLSDVSSKACDCEVVLPELVERESVNLSRIHHSPESTR